MLNRSAILSAICMWFSFQQHAAAQQASFCGTSANTQQQALDAMKGVRHSGLRSTVNIPMQIHMVLNDNGGGDMGTIKLRESICTLNEDFEPAGIQFYMESEVNYIRSTRYNEHNFDDGLEMMRRYNVKNVINVYIVGSPAGNCGYFTYQGDAVALSKSCLGKNSHTWAHEFGHYFSLPHTFFGWEGINYNSGKPTSDFQGQVFTQIENLERSNCRSQADNFCDTPPDYISNRWSCDDRDSSTLIQKDINGQPFRSDGTLFMSYAIDNCMSRFSDEQIYAMNGNYSNLRTDLYRQISLQYMQPFNTSSAQPSDSAITGRKVLFSWEKVENAEGYVFQLSRNQTFTVLIRNLTVTSPFIEVDSLADERRYYWRVIPVSHMDFCTTGSPPFTFQVNSATSAQDVHAEKGGMAYPNPSRLEAGFILKTEGNFNPKEFGLFRCDGSEVTARLSFAPSEQGVLIGTQELDPGVHLLRYKQNHSKIILIR